MEHIKKNQKNLIWLLVTLMILSCVSSPAYAAGLKIKRIDSIHTTVYVNTSYSLPNHIKAVMSNGSVKSVPVRWNAKLIYYKSVGTYQIKGQVMGYKPTVILTVKVVKGKVQPTPTPVLPSPTPVLPSPTPTEIPKPTSSPDPTAVLTPTTVPTPTLTPTAGPATGQDGLVKTVTTLEQFKGNLRYGLSGFMDKIEFTIQGYDDQTYSLEKINDLLIEDPILSYGYTGANGDMTYFGDGSTRNMVLTFHYGKSQEEMRSMRESAEAKATNILAQITTPQMTDLEKEKAIHDYIVNNTRYDIENYNKNTIPLEDYTDYGALVLGTAVCEGYAKAMFRLLNEAGVKCLYVTGYANGEPHAWNKVLISGTYYNVDATFDDPVTSSGTNVLRYNYFNKTDEEFRKDHTWN